MKRKSNISGRDVYIVDGSRTPFLKAKNKLGPFSASDLAVETGKQLLARQACRASDIDEVIIGSAMPGPDEANIGRVIALRLGCGESVPAWTVMRNCASGMQALDNAAQNISNGVSDLVLAGGTDAMSHAPLLFNYKMANWLGQWFSAKSFGQRASLITKFRLSYLAPVIAILRGLTDPIVGLNMGQTAENVAFRFGITRKEMDEFSVNSHHRLNSAFEAKRMSEVTPIIDSKGTLYDFDDGIRPDSSAERLAKLKPFFDKKFGSVTAGNSSQITDGACLLLLASATAVKKHNLPVIAKITDSQWAALDPAHMGLGPVHAATPIMKRHQMSMSDVDYWEINEAFAAQVLGCVRAWDDKAYCKNNLGLNEKMGAPSLDRLNIDGGAVAAGHPIGASGARIVLHLAKALNEKNAEKGIAAICIGGGQGGAMLVEKVAKVG
jgi:acetyl-CoA C-acetyltransferase